MQKLMQMGVFLSVANRYGLCTRKSLRLANYAREVGPQSTLLVAHTPGAWSDLARSEDIHTYFLHFTSDSGKSSCFKGPSNTTPLMDGKFELILTLPENAPITQPGRMLDWECCALTSVSLHQTLQRA